MDNFSDEEEEDGDALLYLPVAPEIEEPEEGWPAIADPVCIYKLSIICYVLVICNPECISDLKSCVY